jgi:peptide-methionine (S)-S-oxide reductase
MASQYQTATLAGGCFWCIEAAFNSVSGIISARSGYMGGHSKNPTYQQVCQGDSGHAEVVQLEFDPLLISYREILEIFFSLHNPTQLNRQGEDIGSQYRSAIFYHNSEQHQQAEKIIAEIENDGIWEQPVVTEVTPSSEFYCGEEYHQQYVENNPQNAYCQAVVSPKLAKFRKTFAAKLK